MNDERTGRTTTPEELFDHTLSIADTSQEALLEGEAVRDEVRRTLEAIDSSYKAVMAEITQHKKELKEAYAPETVQRAVKVSQRTLDEFAKRIAVILEEIQRTADKVKKRLVGQVGLAVAAAAVLLAAICWFCLQWIPNLDDIEKRQLEVAGLQKQIGDFTYELKAMKGRFVQSKGQWYARYDYAPPFTVCDPNDAQSCGTYILVK
jgi:nitrate/nitrite-specific signal transduction histidine kinase